MNDLVRFEINPSSAYLGQIYGGNRDSTNTIPTKPILSPSAKRLQSQL
ncbi:MAG: hypothetical protein RIB93_20795 [Coleofasciculus sp. D1-CHI-01]